MIFKQEKTTKAQKRIFFSAKKNYKHKGRKVLKKSGVEKSMNALYPLLQPPSQSFLRFCNPFSNW